jgi:hypothetical protein
MIEQSLRSDLLCAQSTQSEPYTTIQDQRMQPILHAQLIPPGWSSSSTLLALPFIHHAVPALLAVAPPVHISAPHPDAIRLILALQDALAAVTAAGQLAGPPLRF